MEIVLHLGAHKTASTYFQRRLGTSPHVLNANDITFVSPREYRPALIAASPSNRFLSRLDGTKERRRQVLGDMLASAEARGHSRFILSEENLIGMLDPVLRGAWLYDEVEQKLKSAAEFTRGHPVHALLSIRNYADFFASAYAEAIKLSGFSPFDDTLRRRCTNMDRGWPDVISEVLDGLPPGSRLSVWQFEAIGEREPEILDLFLGKSLAWKIEPLTDRPQRGPSARAIAHLHQLAHRGTSIGRHRIRRVLRDNPKKKGVPAFDPWTGEERRLLANRYDHDLKRIVERWPGLMSHSPIQSDFVKVNEPYVTRLSA